MKFELWEFAVDASTDQTTVTWYKPGASISEGRTAPLAVGWATDLAVRARPRGGQAWGSVELTIRDRLKAGAPFEDITGATLASATDRREIDISNTGEIQIMVTVPAAGVFIDGEVLITDQTGAS